MLCPNCAYTLSPYKAGQDQVLHCEVCGGTFFAQGTIDRISVGQAQELSKNKRQDLITDTVKVCPKDHSTLEPFRGDANYQELPLLECPQCKGTFAYPDDLLSYKKTSRGGTWTSVPALRNVGMVLVVGILSLALFSGLRLVQNPLTTRSQATEIITDLSVTRSGIYLLTTFRTREPLQSKIIFTDITTGKTIEKTISQELSTVHYLATGDLDLSHNLIYKIELYNDKAQIVTETPDTQIDLKQ